MKLLLSLAVLLLAFGTLIGQENNRPQASSTPAASQKRSVYNPSPEERELIHLSEEWMDAALRMKDEKRIRDLMAAEFTLQVWDASRATTIGIGLTLSRIASTRLNSNIQGQCPRFWRCGRCLLALLVEGNVERPALHRFRIPGGLLGQEER